MARKKYGALRYSVAFDAPADTRDARGGTVPGFGAPEDAVTCQAEFIYDRGAEAVQAARPEGEAMVKVRIPQSTKTRQITTAWRMRDARSEAVYNIRSIDHVTDLKWSFLVVESGVAI